MVRNRALTLVACGATLALAIAAPLEATPQQTNTCSQAVKIEDPADGTYAVFLADGRAGSITLDVDEASQTFDFTSNLAWAEVVVKGGPGSNVYLYDPPVSAASGLHAPLNEASGAYYGLSHACFVPAPANGGGE